MSFRSGLRRTGSSLAELGNRLTNRDRQLLDLIYEHRVLTTEQVRDLAFGSARRAELRLAELNQLGLVDRFRPPQRPGSAPYHYVLGRLGAEVVAASRGVEVRDLAWSAGRALALAHSSQLRHLVGVNGFFCALAAYARRIPDTHLREWWSERRCRREWGEFVRPDGYGVWEEGGVRLPFVLEYDRGTETLGRLADKLGGYERLAAAVGYPTLVLVRVPTPRREIEARRALRAASGPAATAALERQTCPAERVWLPLPDSAPRLRLCELGALVHEHPRPAPEPARGETFTFGSDRGLRHEQFSRGTVGRPRYDRGPSLRHAPSPNPQAQGRRDTAE